MATEAKTKKKTTKTAKNTTFAVIKAGGKQYVVKEGDTLKIEKINTENIKAGKLTFDEVLLTDDGKETKVGTPTVKGAKVVAEVIEEMVKEKKVNVIRFRAKSRHNVRKGHRQPKTLIKISEIK